MLEVKPPGGVTMLEHLPDDIRRGLAAARRRDERARARLCVHLGDAAFPIRRLWEGGFAVEAACAPRLRGVVNIFDGPRHLLHALIIASELDEDEMRYEFKRVTAARTRPARDYADEAPEPSGYLPRLT